MTTNGPAPATAAGRVARRRGILAPALLAVLALGLGACAGQDPIPPLDPHGQGSPDGPGIDLPTTDEGLAYDAETLQSVDDEIERFSDDTAGLTLEDVRMLQASTLDNLVPTPELVVGIEPFDEYDSEWETWALGDGFMTSATFDSDMATLLDEETFSLDVRDAEDQEAFEVLDVWQVSVEQAAETALPLAPGEILAILPPDDAATVVLVVIRQEDGTMARVAIDSVTGEPINVVSVDDGTSGGIIEDEQYPDDDADDRYDSDEDSEVPPPCSCEDPLPGGEADSAVTGTLA
ncbi:hypothetical protein CZ771_11390 [Actinomycetales bacterium JB111]|nr:hypothetical protein CZ771_11390 [Actinomycetales bacterium JB111]